MTNDIRVYCDDPSHEGHKGKVAWFFRSDEGWQAMPVGSPGRNFRRARASGSLDVMRQVGEDGHVKYRLRCPLCGIDEQVGDPERVERLHNLLDELARRGVPAISLRGLAASIVKR